MKTNFLITVLFAVMIGSSFAQKYETTTMKVEGFYTGKNLLVKNFYGGSVWKEAIGFCIIEIKTNGHISPANIAAEIVEVPLDILHKVGVKIGDSVKVEIRYKVGCSPKIQPAILNPGALLSYQNKLNSNENRMILQGEFTWGSLLMINPYNTADKKYCIKDIKINGKAFETDLNKEIVSLDLTKLGQTTVFNSEEEEKSAKAKGGLKEGDKIQIEIVYSKSSDPTILNPELITPWSVKQ